MGLVGRTRACSILLMILATAVLLALGAPALLGQRVPAGDGRGWFLPHFVLLSDHIRQGKLLSWDPWTEGGVPTFTEPQAGAYSPITLILGLVSGGSVAGYNAYVWLMSWLAMTGMFLLARTLRAGAWGAAVLALGYAGCGVFLGQPHVSHHVAMAFVPWMLWRVEVYLRQGKPRALLQAGALGGLAGLSAHPAALFYCGVFCGLYWLGRVILRDSGRKKARPVWKRAWVVPAVAVGAAIIAPVYVLFMTEGAGVHARVTGVSREMAQAISLDPRAVSSAISPAAPLAQVADNNLWPGTEASLTSVYCGIVPLLLAGVCLAARPRRAWSWWLLGCGVLLLGLAMGRHLPLHGAVYEAVPPLRLLRHAAIFRLGWILAVAVLAIGGLRELRCLRRRGAGVRAPVFVTLVAIGGVAQLVGWRYVLPVLATLPEAHAVAQHLMLWWVAVAALAGLIVLPLRGRVVLAGVVVALAMADYALSYRLSARLMFDADTTYWSALASRHHPGLSLPTWYRAEGARGTSSTAIVTKEPALVAYTTLRSGYLRQLATCPPLRQMAVGAERVWFCPNPPREPCSTEALAELMGAGMAAGRPLMVLHSAASMRSPVPPTQLRINPTTDRSGAIAPAEAPQSRQSLQGLASPLEARLLKYEPESMVFEVRCPSDGWLMVTDRWAPGWHAQVNGEPAEIWGADTLFRAVPVRSGNNTIAMEYRPALRYPLLALSWATLGAMGLASLLPAFRPVRSRSGVPAVAVR